MKKFAITNVLTLVSVFACATTGFDGKEVVLSYKDGKPTAGLKIGEHLVFEVSK